MGATIKNTIISLRRNTESEYNNHPDFIPKKGEVCFVDTIRSGLRMKIGDGINYFSDLPYEFANITTGYYYNGNFYYDENHSAVATGYAGVLYVDLSNSYVYRYINSAYVQLYPVPQATSEVAGIMKLYNTTGNNEDGAMT